MGVFPAFGGLLLGCFPVFWLSHGVFSWRRGARRPQTTRNALCLPSNHLGDPSGGAAEGRRGSASPPSPPGPLGPPGTPGPPRPGLTEDICPNLGATPQF